MRLIYRAALTLLLTACIGGTASAAEPDAPGALVTRSEQVRIAIQKRLSAKFNSTTKTKKSEQGALVEFYAAPDQRLLWVGENGVTNRGKAVIAEIEKADDYGLRASDYVLPEADTFDVADADTAEWLADAEIKISYAVLRYARDARGGRIEPARLSRNLDPSLALPNPSEVIEFDRLPLGSGRLSPKLSARSASIRGPQTKTARAPRRQGRDAPSPRSSFRMVPCSSSASRTSR